MNASDKSSTLTVALPPLPTDPKSHGAWKAWGLEALDQGAFNVLPADSREVRDPRVPFAWWTLIATWAKVSPEPHEIVKAAQKVFAEAAKVPSPVARAAQLFLEMSMLNGATSPEVLYLAGAFAWPLRYVHPSTSKLAWHYLIHAPWQTSSDVLGHWSLIAGRSAGGEERTLLDLVQARFEAGHPTAAVELLEAMVLAWCGKEVISQVQSVKDLRKDEDFPQAEQALVLLARTYVRLGVDQVWAREILRKARELESQTGEFQEALERTSWDRPLVEAYGWTDQKPVHVFEQEIRRALEARQPHHARRLAEALLTRELSPVRILDPGQKDVESALRKFVGLPPPELLQRGPVRSAAEHLALLYSRTGYATTGARLLVDQVLRTPVMIGAGAPLQPAQEELERFLTSTDPFLLLREQRRRLETGRSRLSEDEQRAAEQVGNWFDARLSQPTSKIAAQAERVIKIITAPISEAASAIASLPGIEEVCSTALKVAFESSAMLAGDLHALRARGGEIQQAKGAGASLLEFAREMTHREAMVAGVASAGLSLIPGSSLLTTAADLGVLLVAAFRVVARVGAIFGIPLDSEQGRAFVLDSLAMGASSKDAEGLMAYLSRGKRSAVTAVSVGGVAYGGMALAGHLWTATGQQAAGASAQLIGQAARLVGFSVVDRDIAKLIPFAGAVISGMATQAFIAEIRDAAIHLATHQALLVKVEAS